MSDSAAPPAEGTDEPVTPSSAPGVADVPAADDSGDASLSGGNYALLRRRLAGQATAMADAAAAIDTERVATYGSTRLALVGASRISTTVPCTPRDIARVGDVLVLGFNTDLELGSVTPAHVFGLYRAIDQGGDHLELQPIAADDADNLLADPAFRTDFDKLYRFYGKARFTDLRVANNQLLAVFSVGDRPDDIQALRWTVTDTGAVTYLDARGDRDYRWPSAHDVDWQTATREDQRAGAHPTTAVLDEVFVGFRNGRLQLRVDAGSGTSHAEIDEPIDHPNQSLTDVTVHYATTGDVLLITVELYGEAARSYVFARSTRTGKRVDAAGRTSRILPGGDGIIFCGGFHTTAAGTRTFEVDVDDMLLEEVTVSPNGEDQLYVYHRRSDGVYVLMPYNMVRREVDQIIQCHGYAIFDNGDMVLFRGSPQDEQASSTHPIQWWETPFRSADHVPELSGENDWIGRVGNAALVDGIGSIFDLQRVVTAASPTRRTWESAATAARRILDTNLWLGDEPAAALHTALEQVADTVGDLIDEFAVRQRQRQQATQQLSQVGTQVRQTLSTLQSANTPAAVVAAMGEIRRCRAAVAAAGEIDEVDTAAIEQLVAQLDEANTTLSAHAVEVLDDRTAFATFETTIGTHATAIQQAATAGELDSVATELDKLADDLGAVIDTVAALESGDATVRTRIVRSVSDVTGALNRARAALDTRRRTLRSSENAAAFDAELALIEQTMGGSVAAAATPEECDAVLARLLVTVERLEGRYGDDPERGARLAELRAAIHEAVEARRSALVDERTRRADRIVEAGQRLQITIARRAGEQKSDHEIEAFFATDQMCGRVRELADELERLGDSGRAAELRHSLTAAAEHARRSLRDRVALGDDDASVRLGEFRLARNSQPFELVLSTDGDDRIAVTVTGTDYRADVTSELAEFADLLSTPFPSETPDVSRSEYLAWAAIATAEAAGDLAGLISDAAEPATLSERITALAEQRHSDGYQRGVHDTDAARIVAAVAGQLDGEPLLRYTPTVRGLGRLWWSTLPSAERGAWSGRISASVAPLASFGGLGDDATLVADLAAAVDTVVGSLDAAPAVTIAQYLIDELADGLAFTVTDTSKRLAAAVSERVGAAASERFATDLAAIDDVTTRFGLARRWVQAYVAAATSESNAAADLLDADDVAATLAIGSAAIETVEVTGASGVVVTELTADHPRIVDGSLTVRVDALAGLAGARFDSMATRWPEYQTARRAVVDDAAARLHLDEHRPQPMAGFVRNTLIDDALLPLFGANLARQCGTVDSSDLARQGLLVVVSPPGYGKTTLMEWLADQLGMLLVKVNGPALGHDTESLDPADAPNATARAEVQKLNLAFRLGRNVMLYVDDVQHTSPVLLSRFIPLADATRRIEGVIDGKPHTFDLRGKRFCVVMAGNPYTTGGGRFELPDMLVNRSDVHNLGDVSGSAGDAFAASYLENAVTANATLAPHAARLLDDLGGITQMAARRQPVDTSNLQHNWDAADLDRAVKSVRLLARARDVLLEVNAAYIASASRTERDRQTPPFLLQGSYRNMARLAARVVPVMTDEELDRLVDEHYAAEAQTLTDRAEQNLLAYKHLVDRASPDEAERWRQIVTAFQDRQAAADPASAVVAAIGGLTEAVTQFGNGEPTAPS